MNKRRFFFQLFMLAALMAAAVLFLQMFPVFKTAFGFSIASVGFFSLISVVMFFTAAKAAMNKDKNAFTRLILVFTMGKMFLSAALVISYHLIAKPGTAFFVLPFFLVYIAFTIFETIFLTKLGKIKAR